MSEVNLLKEMVKDGNQEAAEMLAMLPEEPPISVHSSFYWRAYLQLGRDRPVGMDGMAQIPYTSLCRYCDEMGIEGIERETFKEIIMKVDDFEVNQTHEKRRQEQAKAKLKR